MINLLLDIAPLPRDREHWEVVERGLRQAADSVDTITGAVIPVTDSTPTSGHGTTWAIIGAIAAALAALAILIFFVRVYRNRQDQLQSLRCKPECT